MIRRRTTTIPAPTTAPTSTPPPASTTNSPAPCSRAPVAAIPAAPPTARETAIWYSTRLVPSLNKLSACTSVCTLTGSESRRASALTATGSVLAKTAPSTNAMLADNDATATPTTATAAAEASTSPTASTATGRHTARRSRQASSSLAAYSSGGSTTRLTTSGGTSIAGALGSKPTARPATTSREGAGTRSRRAKAATTVASATSNTTVSTVRTPAPPSVPMAVADQTSRRYARPGLAVQTGPGRRRAAAGRDGVPQQRHGPCRVVGVGPEVQDRE